MQKQASRDLQFCSGHSPSLWQGLIGKTKWALFVDGILLPWDAFFFFLLSLSPPVVEVLWGGSSLTRLKQRCFLRQLISLGMHVLRGESGNGGAGARRVVLIFQVTCRR